MNDFFNINPLNSQDNLGGGHRFLFINPDDIVSDPAMVHNNVEDSFTLVADATWYEAAFTELTLLFEEKQVNKKGSHYTTSILKGSIPVDNSPNLYLLFKMAKKGIVVIYTDNNGNSRIIGSKRSPAILSRRTKHGDVRVPNANYFTISSITTLEGAPFFQSTIPTYLSCAITVSIHGLFEDGYPDLPDYTVTAEAVGTYNTLLTDGVSDPITIKVNNVVKTMPITLALNDIVKVTRLNTNAPGWYKLTQ